MPVSDSTPLVGWHELVVKNSASAISTGFLCGTRRDVKRLWEGQPDNIKQNPNAAVFIIDANWQKWNWQMKQNASCADCNVPSEISPLWDDHCTRYILGRRRVDKVVKMLDKHTHHSDMFSRLRQHLVQTYTNAYTCLFNGHFLPRRACISHSLYQFIPLSVLTAISSSPWVSWYQNVSILDFIGAKGDGGGNIWSHKKCRAPDKMLPPTNQHLVSICLYAVVLKLCILWGGEA